MFTLRGVPGGPKNLKKHFLNFFFKSCLESSETNFGIKISHFENFHTDPPGGPLGGQKFWKNIFFKISTHNFTQFKFELIWSKEMRIVSIWSYIYSNWCNLLANPRAPKGHLWKNLDTPVDLQMTNNATESQLTCIRMCP